MAVFKCKMCGGTIEFAPGDSVGICDSCGTKQTLPRLDSDKKAQLYDRADHFRRNNEFDKAMGIYEQILNEDEDDAEAYWSLVLCKYGIEYVEDPATHRRIPTVNRAQYTSIFDDEDYKAALRRADGHQREIYEQEAGTINEIQKGILAISAKEEPFDVFICYKETDANGRRTPDSVLANDLYHQLTQEGFKVFFARITLEDKLGSAYEPYIFAALNSAKVMVVLGTRPAYFQAAWVKNEWSRYLALVKESGGKKILIPAYKDMDPYDLPEEFSHLQAQDMSKLGFMQDLIRGIRKIMAFDAPQAAARENVVVKSENGSVQAFLDRGFMALEDGEWSKADEFFERALDFDAKLAEAYLGKLMAQLQVSRREQLADAAEPFDEQSDYQKAVRFGDEQMKAFLQGAVAQIRERNENARLDSAYDRAVEMMKAAGTEQAFKIAAAEFQLLEGHRDAEELAQLCLGKAEECRKDAIYLFAKSMLPAKQSGLSTSQEKKCYQDALKSFMSIPGWCDADEQAKLCQQEVEKIEAAEEAERLEAERRAEERRIASEKAAKKRKKFLTIAIPVTCACVAFLILLTTVIIPNNKYNNAVSLMNEGKYEEAICIFLELNGYKDSLSTIYNSSVSLMNEGKTTEAYKYFTALNDYKDSKKIAAGLFVQFKTEELKTADVGDIVLFGSYAQDKNAVSGKENIEWQVLAKEDNRILVISKYALDFQRYNSSYNPTTWETCPLRKWLNIGFIDAAFSAEEKAMILTVTVPADKNPEYSADPGNVTQDKVFLLSINEVKKYFSSDEARKCAMVMKKQGNARLWWLRSPGNGLASAAFVDNDGSVNCSGFYVDKNDICIRPAMWISLEP